MSSKPMLHVTGPNGEQVPICLFPFPAATDELISMEEWLENARAFAQSDPPPAPKPTKADDVFRYVFLSILPRGIPYYVDKATFGELWAYLVEKNRKAHLEDSDADAPKAKL
ncbi:hypothetical protein NW754_003416 [Fusarium falciforme]|nr:hypothetical protein NW754_003416 [Fusarium falciforme]